MQTKDGTVGVDAESRAMGPPVRETHFGDRRVLCFPDRPNDVVAMFAETVRNRPDHEALVAGERRISYRELDRLVERAAGRLLADGLGAGDRVCLLLGNRPDFLVLLLAILRIGAIAVPVNPREQRDGLAFILTDCQAAALVSEAGLEDRIPDPAVVSWVRRFYRIADAVGLEPAGASHHAPAARRCGEEDTAILLYTSGTTGRPKGAMLTHLNLVHSVMHYQQVFGLGPRDRSMLVVPASHVTGVVAILLAMVRCGGCSVMMRDFEVHGFLARAARERITHTVMVPAMYNLCLLRADLGEHDLSAWRIGAYGGAPMPEATIAALSRALPGLQLANAYGATETTSPATVMPPGRTRERPDSVGLAVACAEIRIVDEAGAEVAAGEAGEVLIKGPMVVPGYWNRPEETDANFRDGWWCSGDIGALDGDGFLAVFDRRKDMINRGGYKIYSAELENTLAHHPAVGEVAAIARPDPVLGERIHCFVVPAGAQPDPGELRDFCGGRLADYKVPDSFTFLVEPLPRNANGKVMKLVLKEWLERRQP